MVTPPKSIGPYVIERELGRGGMGVVLLGRDPRLERLVAIKGISPALSSDPEQLARLLREARILASLAHPNIVTIYGIEEDAGNRYLVMEYVDGQDLSERLALGPISFASGIAICAQVAAAVETAHKSGIIHRDLKPANVKVMPDGRVKVLDFGLARGSARTPSNTADSDAPTVASHDYTIMGQVLGTPGYMSPEQARGEAIDRRTDIFSFGCLLFECLSRTRVFSGKTQADTVALTLTAEPDWKALPAHIPPRLRELLHAALHKEPEDRLGDIASMRAELQGLASAAQRASIAPTSEMLSVRPMPRPSRIFIGRHDELHKVTEFIRASRAIALVATGGSGKTRLALKLIDASKKKQNIAYIEAGTASDEKTLTRLIGRALALKSPASFPAPLIEAIGGRELLLVMDDADLLKAPSATLAAELLAACPGLRILTLGREGLGLPGEVAHRLPPMQTPQFDQPVSVDELMAFEAFKLFYERALDIDPRFELSMQRRLDVCKIVKRLGGSPLAIEIVAARIALIPLATILEGLDTALRPLAVEAAGALQRQQVLRAIIKWSFDLLSPREQQWLMRLCGLIGGFSVEDAIQACSDEGEQGGAVVTPRDMATVLESLSRKSLIICDAGPDGDPCYGVHPSIRQACLKRASSAIWK